MENQESTTPTVTTRSAGVRFGLIMGAIGIVLFIAYIVAGIDIQGPAKWVNTAVFFVVVFLAHKYYKENGDGYMTIGQGTGIGFWMSLVSSVLSSAFTYIYSKFIDTGFTQQLLDTQRQAMEEKGTLSEEQIDQAMQMTAKFMSPEMIVAFGLFFGVLFGIIVALIVGLFTQKKNPEPFA